jgi:hypothetical protein
LFHRQGGDDNRARPQTRPGEPRKRIEGRNRPGTTHVRRRKRAEKGGDRHPGPSHQQEPPTQTDPCQESPALRIVQARRIEIAHGDEVDSGVFLPEGRERPFRDLGRDDSAREPVEKSQSPAFG